MAIDLAGPSGARTPGIVHWIGEVAILSEREGVVLRCVVQGAGNVGHAHQVTRFVGCAAIDIIVVCIAGAGVVYQNLKMLIAVFHFKDIEAEGCAHLRTGSGEIALRHSSGSEEVAGAESLVGIFVKTFVSDKEPAAVNSVALLVISCAGIYTGAAICNGALQFVQWNTHEVGDLQLVRTLSQVLLVNIGIVGGRKLLDIDVFGIIVRSKVQLAACCGVMLSGERGDVYSAVIHGLVILVTDVATAFNAETGFVAANCGPVDVKFTLGICLLPQRQCHYRQHSREDFCLENLFHDTYYIY